jgi:class 3 adenylate cyclase/pimeloyl-ACP methyl ester carboxylesterase
MEKPPIQYVTTSDGVSIAYSVAGAGPGLPVVGVDLPSRLQFDEKQFPAIAGVNSFMTRRGALVVYDHRGFGFSDRNITKFPLDDMVKDLEAVVDKLALERFIVTAGGFNSTLIAIAYAAKHPQRVAKLSISAVSHVPPEVHQQYLALMVPGSDWRFVSEAISRLSHGWDDDDFSRSMAAWYRESSTYETFKLFWTDMAQWDVRSLLPAIEMPVLIMAMPKSLLYTVEQGREMASLMPHGQLVVAEGATFKERLSAFQAVGSFIYGPEAVRPFRDAQPSASGAPTQTGLTVMLFADIVDSTPLMERMGDEAFRTKARALDESLRKAIRDANGTAVEGKLVGDGILAVFSAARDAINAALACRDASREVGLELHLGIHAGDVIREGNNVYGGPVNIAARISAQSPPGEVLVSDTVRSLARTSTSVTFEDRGEQMMKGVGEPVRVYAVRRA